MPNICISSEVTSNYISAGTKNFPLLNETFDLDILIRENWIVFFNDARIIELVEFLSESIDKLLTKRNAEVSSTRKAIIGGREVEFLRTSVAKIIYKNEELKFDMRDNYDFHVYLMISLYNYSVKVINYNGNLFFYNREIIDEFGGFDLVALLRVKYSLTKQELLNELEQIKDSSRFLKIRENIDTIIEKLKRLGVLDLMSVNDKLVLSPRGYMLH